jgi:hypothetical protein
LQGLAPFIFFVQSGWLSAFTRRRRQRCAPTANIVRGYPNGAFSRVPLVMMPPRSPTAIDP